MLSNPRNGWATITIGDFESNASYLTDIPINTLNSFIDTYNRWEPAVIKYDAEGYEFIAVSDDTSTYVINNKAYDSIHDNDTRILTVCNIGKKELAKEVLKDIKDNFVNWVTFIFNDSDEVLEERDRLLSCKINTLEELINKYG